LTPGAGGYILAPWTSRLLDKWKTAPRVDDIMRYLQKRIDARRRTGILFDDEIRTELGSG